MIEVSIDELIPGRNYYFIKSEEFTLPKYKNKINVGKCKKYYGTYVSQTNDGIATISINFKNIITAIYANKPPGFIDKDCKKVPDLTYVPYNLPEGRTFLQRYDSSGKLYAPFYIFYKDTAAVKPDETIQGLLYHKLIKDITGDPYAARLLTEEYYPGSQATDYIPRHKHGSNTQFQPTKKICGEHEGCTVSGGNRLRISRTKNKRVKKNTVNRRFTKRIRKKR